MEVPDALAVDLSDRARRGVGRGSSGCRDLATGRGIASKLNVIVVGKTGVGKSYVGKSYVGAALAQRGGS